MKGLIYLYVTIGSVAAQCNFPTKFLGTWVSSADGTWTVNSSHLLDFKVTGISGITSLSFTCYEVQGNLYALESTYAIEIFTATFRHLYTCLDIRFSTPVKYIYYKNTDTGSPSASDMTTQTEFSKICNKTNYDMPYYHHVALISGSEVSALTTCPETLFGNFHYDTCTDPSSTNTSVNVCDTREQLVYDYSLCNTEQMFSADGVLDCVYFVDSGTVTYLTVYNRDSTQPDGVTYFRFSCLAIEELSNSTRLITASPEQCVDNQDPSSIASPGQAYQFTPYYLCPITTTVPTTTTVTTSTESTTIQATIDTTTQSAQSNSSNSASSTDIGLIVGIAIGVIVVLIIIALIILYCCIRKRRKRKKLDEERAIAEDTDDQRSQRSGERRDSERSGSDSSVQDDDKRSIDSGLGREPTSFSGRGTDTDYRRLTDQDGQGQEAETVKIVGEVDLEDKSVRPQSEQGNQDETNDEDKDPKQSENKSVEDADEREIEKNGGHTSGVKQFQNNEGSSSEDAHAVKIDDAISEGGNTSMDGRHLKNNETTHTSESEETVLGTQDGNEEMENEEQRNNLVELKGGEEKSDDQSEYPGKNETENISEAGDDEKDKQIRDNTNENSKMDGDSSQSQDTSIDASKRVVIIVTPGEERSQDKQEDGHDTDGEDVVDSKNVENKTEEDIQKIDKRRERTVIGLTSDGEEIYATASDDDTGDDDSSLDDVERERMRIGEKKGTTFTPAGPLTTILVSRQDEERKRNKLKPKSKRQKMRKLAKHKTKKPEGDTRNKHEDRDKYSSEDDDNKRHGTPDAPYIEQYLYKKRIETQLNEEHYWSEPADDRDELRRAEDMGSSVSSNTASITESDAEGTDADFLGPQGIAVNKTKHSMRNVDKKEGTKNQNPNSPKSKVKDGIIIVNGSESKRTDLNGKPVGNQDVIKNETDTQVGKIVQVSDIADTKILPNASADKKTTNEEDLKKQPDKQKYHKRQNGSTKFIHVQEHEGSHKHLQSVEVRRVAKREEKRKKGKSDQRNAAVDTEKTDNFENKLDKGSDTDSGVEDEEILDVVLTEEQQEMIVNVLFDEESRLREAFYRDENGRIIRKLDNTVIYDPHTGRLTFRRRLGRLFNAPRLKRNNRGRPTGGYKEDEYGPKRVERKKSSASRCSRRDLESRLSLSDSTIYDKRSRGESRNVGFSVPVDELDTVSVRDLENQKRGRRDTGSGIRRKLKNRLFRKRRKRTDPSSMSIAQGGHPRTAWTTEAQQTPLTGSDGELNPILHRGGRAGYSTPQSRRRLGNDPQQWQKYREGLESDRRILAGFQDKLVTDCKGEAEYHDDENAFDTNIRFSENEEIYDDSRQDLRKTPAYWNENGRFIVRERGCPELEPSPLFTIVRRPGTMVRKEQISNNDAPRWRDPPKSAPVQMQSHAVPANELEKQDCKNNTTTESSNSETQASYIDDNRLRRLLEELYRDKKYFDNYVDTTEPKSEVVIHTKGLAEHGRGYLLDMADFWEKRGPLPPRPPQTEIGWKMQRQQTLMDSARTSERSSTATVTPDIRPYTVPGYVDVKSPRDNAERNNERNESFV